MNDHRLGTICNVANEPRHGTYTANSAGQASGNYASLVTRIADTARNQFLRSSRVLHHWRYLRENYWTTIQPGHGAETIIDFIDRYQQQGMWIDVGCGPLTPFWSVAVHQAHAVVAADADPEALAVLAAFLGSDVVPPAYRDVATSLGRGDGPLDRIRKQPPKMVSFDALESWPFSARVRFDFITSIGLLGLCRGPDHYCLAVRHMAAHLAVPGYAVGANWRFTDSLARRRGHDNAWLNESVVEDAARRSELELVQLATVPISGDEDYDRVLVWAVRSSGRSS